MLSPSLHLILLLHNSYPHLLFLLLTLVKVAKRLKPSKGVGADGLPSFIIKGCYHILIPLLTYIFNLSTTSETFPSLWKQAAAAVVPLLKKVSSRMVSNYRPVSYYFQSFLIYHP